VERTRILIHIIDMAACDGRDPVRDYRAINSELRAYSAVLCKKPQVIVANKMDLEGAQENLEVFKRAVKRKVYPICALRSEGVEGLIEDIAKRLQKSSRQDR
jgi:GTP-binding protein